MYLDQAFLTQRFNEFYTGSTSQSLATVDKELLDVVGFHTAAPVTAVIEAFGSTSLVEGGNIFVLIATAAALAPSWKFLARQLLWVSLAFGRRSA